MADWPFQAVFAAGFLAGLAFFLVFDIGGDLFLAYLRRRQLRKTTQEIKRLSQEANEIAKEITHE